MRNTVGSQRTFTWEKMALKAFHMLGMLLVLERGSCSQLEEPSVEPANATHLKVSWKDFGGKANSQHLYWYRIVLDDKELPIQEDLEQYSVYVKADPCLMHDVAMKLSLDEHPVYGDDKTLQTKKAHYNDPDNLDLLYSGLLREGVNNLCKIDNDLYMRDFPEEIRERCIRNIVEGKDGIFFEIVNPDKRSKKDTICLKGTTQAFQCRDNGTTTTNIVPEPIEHAPMEHCQERHTTTELNQTTTEAIVIGLVASFLVLAILGFLGFCIKKRKEARKERGGVRKEEENPVYGLYQFEDGEVAYTTAEVTDVNEVYGQ